MFLTTSAIVDFLVSGMPISMLLPTGIDGDGETLDDTPPDNPEPDTLNDLSLLDEIYVSGTATVAGDANGNLMRGDDDDNSIRSFGGNDVVFGDYNDDQIDLGRGEDVAFGQAGNDSIYGGDDADLIRGNRGSDFLVGEEGKDYLIGGPGDDTLRGGQGSDVLVGNKGNDRLFGGNAGDMLYGQDGADRLYGHQGDDQLFGGSQQDSLFGGEGDDLLAEGRWADELDGGSADDILLGEGGSDALDGGGGDNFLIGGPGEDELLPGRGDDFVSAVELVNKGGKIIDTDAGDTVLLSDGVNVAALSHNNDVVIEGGQNALLIGDFIQLGDGELPPLIEGFGNGNNAMGFLYHENTAAPTLSFAHSEDLDETAVLSNGSPVAALIGGDFTGASITAISYDPTLVAANGITTILEQFPG
jgi:Ca2+-binding RTX toxin-like protein